MSFLTRAIELGNASTNISEEGMDSFIKSASESNITVNDMNMAHNLTSEDVNLYTGEGVIPQDEAIEVSRLSGAVDLMVKQASVDPLTEVDAVAYLGEIGLTVDDYNEIYDHVPEDLVTKVAAEMDETEVVADTELTADDAVWDKVAEVHSFLTDAGLDPVASLNFAADFNEAEGQDAQDKVASEVEDLEQAEIDKIAEAVEYLSDIEGIHPADLMAEWDKTAGARMDAMKLGLKNLGGKIQATGTKLKGKATKGMDAAKAGVKSAKKTSLKIKNDLTGENLKRAMGDKSTRGAKRVAGATKDTRNARIGAGVLGTAALAGTGYAATK